MLVLWKVAEVDAVPNVPLAELDADLDGRLRDDAQVARAVGVELARTLLRRVLRLLASAHEVATARTAVHRDVGVLVLSGLLRPLELLATGDLAEPLVEVHRRRERLLLDDGAQIVHLVGVLDELVRRVDDVTALGAREFLDGDSSALDGLAGATRRSSRHVLDERFVARERLRAELTGEAAATVLTTRAVLLVNLASFFHL